MTKIEALELELTARKMVEGTRLSWVNCLRHRYLQAMPFCLECYDICDIELALGTIEGRPVWNGDEYYDTSSNKIIARGGLPQDYWNRCSWNPPKYKTEKIGKLKELLSIQKSSCDCHNDNYFRGMYNGMEVMLACVEERKAEFIGKPKPKTVMVELPLEVVNHGARHWSDAVGEACRKALDGLK